MTPIQELNETVAEIRKQAAQIARFYRYYNGDHDINFASEKFNNKFGERLQKLHDNLCKAVVNAPASRLEVLDFGSDVLNIGDDAWKIWRRNFMPRCERDVYREAFRTGSAFVTVWPNRKTRAAGIYPQRASECKVWKDPETDRTLKAAKRWTSHDIEHLTIYYPDRIEKYSATKDSVIERVTGTAFQPRFVESEPWPMPNPFGEVPVFEFTTTENRSILEDVIPLNDALNKTLADVMTAGENNAIRKRWLSGVQFERDEETGKGVVPFEFDDQAWCSPNVEARFGEFPDVSLGSFVQVASQYRDEIARVSGIPLHYFAGSSGSPSGEALRTAEAGFTAMITDGQLSFGEVWAEVMELALAMDRKIFDREIEIVVRWRDAGPTSLSTRLKDGLKKQELGIARKVILEELGYTNDQMAPS